MSTMRVPCPAPPGHTAIRALASPRNELEVDFRTGDVVNLTTGKRLSIAPLAGAALEILEAGGEANWLRAHASQGGGAHDPTGEKQS